MTSADQREADKTAARRLPQQLREEGRQLLRDGRDVADVAEQLWVTVPAVRHLARQVAHERCDASPERVDLDAYPIDAVTRARRLAAIKTPLAQIVAETRLPAPVVEYILARAAYHRRRRERCAEIADAR